MLIPPQDRRACPELDEDDLRALRPVATQESFEPGTELLRFGQRDIDLFVVEAGRVDIFNPVGDGGDQPLASHGPGQFVGDIDLLTRRPIIFRAVAAGDGAGGPTRVLRVPGDKLRGALNAAPHLGEKLMTASVVRRQTVGASGGSLGLQVLGPPRCSHTNRIREFLHKNFVPFTWTDSEVPAGREAVRKLGGSPRRLPIVDCGGGVVLGCPSLRELANVAGVWRGCPDQEVDLAIVGAGPAGIAAAVYAASEGLRTIVLDRLGPGGQAGGSSKIENFIGFPAGLSGTDLATRGVLQMLKFGASMIAPVSVERVEVSPEPEAPHTLHLDCGAQVRARTVLASTGVTWRRLEAEGADRFERAGIYYACTIVEARLHDDCDVAVVGAGNSAGQAAMFLADQHAGRRVHLLVRRTLGPGMSQYLVGRLRGTSNVVVHEGVEVSAVRGDGHIESLELSRRDGGASSALAVGAAFVFIGAEPHADWLPPAVARDKAGYILTGTDVAKSGLWPVPDRDPCPLETTVPRILAAGDLRAGSTKRVGFAVGDGSLAVTCVHKLAALPV